MGLASLRANTPGETETTIRHNVKRRIERIELLLAWDGEVRRSDLTEFFGISDQQASTDISKYKEIAPDNLVYDTSLKRYLATQDFQPVLLELSADRYLMQLRLLHSGVLGEDQTWFRNAPAFDLAPSLSSGIDAELLRTLTIAMRFNAEVEVKYQSMTRPKPAPRRIAPHSLVHDGRRWHIRAWCFTREAFRDFVLNRLMFIGEPSACNIDPQHDEKWHTFIPVNIAPHHALTDAQKKTIASDYGLPRGRKRLKIRQALLFYFVDFYRLDPTKFGHLEPRHLQIEMENWNEVESQVL